MLPAFSINWLAVLLAFVASMAVGFAIYAKPLFGGWWMRQIGFPPEGPSKDAATKAVSVSAVLGLLLAIGFAIVADWTGATTATDALVLGLVAWMAFGLPVSMVHPLFEGRPWGVGALYAGHHLVEFAVVALILVLMG